MKSALHLEALAKWGPFKLVFFAFCFLLFAFIFKIPVLAESNYQPPSTSNQYLTPATNPDVPKNMHTYTQSIIIELLSSTYCLLAGSDPISPDQKCLGIDPVTRKIGFVENSSGLVGVMGGLVATTFSMPVSSSNYISYLSNNFGFVKKAHADALLPCRSALSSIAGYGFCSISPLIVIWEAMRNIVYLIFTLVFVVIGLAIMLRVHIDPRTVMTLENQIPKIIIGILLVTFSLAISGFLIDIMYLAIYLIGNVLINVDNSIGGTPELRDIFNQIATSSTPFQAITNFKDTTDVVANVANGFTNTLLSTMFGSAQTPWKVNLILTQVDIGYITLFLILWLIFLLALIISLLRLWVTLIMAYIMILLDIIFAPFWFLAGLLPGGSLGVGAWFRDILANLAVFPTTITMLSLAFVFSKIAAASAMPTPTDPDANYLQMLFNPPLVGGIQQVSTVAQLIVFGFIFMLPQALSIVKAAVKAPKFNVGPVFAPAGAATKVIKGTAGGTGSTYMSSKEMIMGQNKDWQERSLGKAIAGRIFK